MSDSAGMMNKEFTKDMIPAERPGTPEDMVSTKS